MCLPLPAPTPPRHCFPSHTHTLATTTTRTPKDINVTAAAEDFNETGQTSPPLSALASVLVVGLTDTSSAAHSQLSGLASDWATISNLSSSRDSVSMQVLTPVEAPADDRAASNRLALGLGLGLPVLALVAFIALKSRRKRAAATAAAAAKANPVHGAQSAAFTTV